MSTRERALRDNDYAFLPKLVTIFLAVLSEISAEGPVKLEEVNFCERFLELCIDLQAQLPTRRFFNSVLLDYHLIVKCGQSGLAARATAEGHLFTELLKMVQFYSK